MLILTYPLRKIYNPDFKWFGWCGIAVASASNGAREYLGAPDACRRQNCNGKATQIVRADKDWPTRPWVMVDSAHSTMTVGDRGGPGGRDRWDRREVTLSETGELALDSGAA